MSIKSKALAGAVALGVAAGGLGVAAASAHATTPSCGYGCVNFQNAHSGGVLDVFKRTAKIGQPIIEWGNSYIDPAEDFVVAAQGTVHQFYKAGLASAALNLHYSHFEAYEIEYAPYGANTGLCVGVAHTAGNGTPVTLQQCGASAKTLWVKHRDYDYNGATPLINGSDNNFSHPYVLTDTANGLKTYNLTKFSNGVVYDTQLWTEV